MRLQSAGKLAAGKLSQMCSIITSRLFRDTHHIQPLFAYLQMSKEATSSCESKFDGNWCVVSSHGHIAATSRGCGCIICAIYDWSCPVWPSSHKELVLLCHALSTTVRLRLFSSSKFQETVIIAVGNIQQQSQQSSDVLHILAIRSNLYKEMGDSNFDPKKWQAAWYRILYIYIYTHYLKYIHL